VEISGLEVSKLSEVIARNVTLLPFLSFAYTLWDKGYIISFDNVSFAE